MSDIQVPSENRIKAQLSRQLRLYSLTARPEAANEALNHIMDHLAALFDQGKIRAGTNTMTLVDERINLIVDTTLQLTKDQKNINFIDLALMQTAVKIIQSFTASQQQQQEEVDGLNNNNTTNNNNGDLYNDQQDKSKKVVNDNVDQAIKYFTLQQTQPVFLLDPFNIPKFSFSTHQNQYLPNALSLYHNPAASGGAGLCRLGNNQQLHSNAAAKAAMFSTRYSSIYQRLQRQERYAQQQRLSNGKGTIQNNAKGTMGLALADTTKIYEVDSLQGNEGELTVFGFISDIVGDIYLESPTARILLDLSNAVLVDTGALKRLKGENDPNGEELYTTYTSNTQLSQAINNHNATPSKSQLTPAKAHTRSPSHRNIASKGVDVNDLALVEHSSVFAKLFGVGSFVLITGYTLSNVFVAKRCQLPQHESRQATLELFPALAVVNPYTDYISNPLQHFSHYFQGKILQHHIQKLQSIQPQMNAIVSKGSSHGGQAGATSSSASSMIDVNAQIKNQKLLLESLLDTTQGHSLDRIIILGECYLHDLETIKKLHSMLSFLEMEPPKFIVFMGNYMSPQFFLQNRSNPYNIKKLFDKLADIIFGYKGLRSNTHFVFGSGTYDYFYADISPTPPIPPTMISRLTKILSHVTFTSNLINLRYYGRDIKIYRADVYKMIVTRDQQQYNNVSGGNAGNKSKGTNQYYADNIFSQSKIIPDDLLPPEILQDRIKREARKERAMKRAEEKANRINANANERFGDDNSDETMGIHNNNNTMASSEHYGGEMVDDINHFEQPVFGEDDDDDDENEDVEQTQTRFISEIVVNHITSQDTLLPDILHQPLLWDYTQAYQLTTLPDALFMVDLVKSYNVTKYGTMFYNTGAFTGQWGFVQYYPASNTVAPVFLPAD